MGCPSVAHQSLFITTVFQKVAVKGLVLLKLASSPAEKGVWAAGGGEKAARDPGYEGTSHSEGALSLREVGPSSGPPCWASGQFTFQTEDHLTVVWSGDSGGAGPTVEGTPGVHLCKGLPV